MADRVHVMADGSRRFVRFSQVEILEHWLAFDFFYDPGLTGLLQRFASLNIVAWTINAVFGGIEALHGPSGRCNCLYCAEPVSFCANSGGMVCQA